MSDNIILFREKFEKSKEYLNFSYDVWDLQILSIYTSDNTSPSCELEIFKYKKQSFLDMHKEEEREFLKSAYVLPVQPKWLILPRGYTLQLVPDRECSCWFVIVATVINVKYTDNFEQSKPYYNKLTFEKFKFFEQEPYLINQLFIIADQFSLLGLVLIKTPEYTPDWHITVGDEKIGTLLFRERDGWNLEPCYYNYYDVNDWEDDLLSKLYDYLPSSDTDWDNLLIQWGVI